MKTEKLETLETLLDGARFRLIFYNVLQDSVFFAVRQLVELLVQQIVERRAGDPQIPNSEPLTAIEIAELEYARDCSALTLHIGQLHTLVKQHIAGEADDSAMADELLKLFPGEFPCAESELQPRDTSPLIQTLERMIEKEKR